MSLKPTNKLRFVERPEPTPGISGMVSTVRKVRVLQQWWELPPIDGHPVGEWRDVELVPPHLE